MIDSDSNKSPDDAPVHAMIQLPNELWSKVIQHLPSKDLKNARRVNGAWNDFSTPLLFRAAVFSPEPANVKNLRQLAKHDHLARHVERLYLDCTSNITGISVHSFANLAAGYFASVMALGSQPPHSPLCEKNLLKVLLTDFSKPLGPKYLTGRPRGHFIAGYTLYSGRTSFAIDMFQKDQVYHILELVTRKFKNLKHMETLSHWSTTDLPYQQDFQRYLVSNLPRKSLMMISGIEIPPLPPGDGMKESTSVFDAPGVSARDLHVMIPGPGYSGCYGRAHWHEIINPALRALRENKVKLESLSLPGGDYLGHNSAPQARGGIVPLPSLLEGAKAPFASKTTSVLLPLFRHLKVLELNIDFKHPGNELRRLRDGEKIHRLRNALQLMKELESLSLGTVPYLLCDISVWDLSTLLLYRKEDYDTECADAQDDDDGIGDGPPANVHEMLDMLFGSAMGTVQAATSNQSTGPSTNNPSTTHSTHSNTDSSQNGVSNIVPPPTLASIMGTTTLNEDGNVFSNHPFAPIPFDFDLVGQQKIPDTPLLPNPWPKLKHLSLWNLPASPNEISRLVKTVKASLKTLNLKNIYFEYHDPPPGHIDHGLAVRSHATHCNPDHDIQDDEEEEEEEDGDDTDSDQDLPSLIEMQGLVQHATCATATDTSQAVTSAINPSEDETQAGLQSHSSTSVFPGMSVPLSASSMGSAFPFIGGPPPVLNFDQPETSSNNEDAEASNQDVGDKWLSTIETLADELRLDACQILLHEAEEDKVRAKMSKHVKDLWKIPVLNTAVSRYLLEGSGIGFPLHLSNTIEEMTQTARKKGYGNTDLSSGEGDERENDDTWEDVGSEQELSEDGIGTCVIQESQPNVHVCSVWQACP